MIFRAIINPHWPYRPNLKIIPTQNTPYPTLRNLHKDILTGTAHTACISRPSAGQTTPHTNIRPALHIIYTPRKNDVFDCTGLHVTCGTPPCTFLLGLPIINSPPPQYIYIPHHRTCPASSSFKISRARGHSLYTLYAYRKLYRASAGACRISLATKLTRVRVYNIADICGYPVIVVPHTKRESSRFPHVGIICL